MSKEFSDGKTMADKSTLDEELILLIPGPGIEPQAESHTLTTQPLRQYM